MCCRIRGPHGTTGFKFLYDDDDLQEADGGKGVASRCFRRALAVKRLYTTLLGVSFPSFAAQSARALEPGAILLVL